MRSRIWWEIRENGPFFLAVVSAMVVFTIAPIDGDLAGGILVAIVTISSGFFGTAPLAREFGEGTIGSLLAQPVSRTQIWFEKWFGAVACWLPLTALYFICAPAVSTGNEPASVSAIIFFNLMVFLAGPFMALVTRTILAAFLYACATPSIIVLFYRESILGLSVAVSTGLLVSSFAWFLRCEDKPSLLGMPLRLPTFNRGKGTRFHSATPVLNRSINALLLKEFRLALPFTMLSTLVSLLMLVAWLSLPHHLRGVAVSSWVFIQFIVVPSLLGVASVMADRIPGVREHQMTAPASMCLQWSIKLLICLLVTSTIALPLTITPALVVGYLDPSEYWESIPALIIPIACVYFAPRLIKAQVSVQFLGAALALSILALPVAMTSLLSFIYYHQGGWGGYVGFFVFPVSISFGVLLIGMYAGSICRTHVRALCAVVLFLLSAGLFAALLTNPLLDAFRFDPKVTATAFYGLALAACFFIGGRLSYSNTRFVRTPLEIGTQLGSIAFVLGIFAMLVVGINQIRGG